MNRLTTPEAIVWFFAERGVTEAHRSAIESQLGIDREKWEQSIGKARDIAEADYDRCLVPIYEREGWWTIEPTWHIAAVALFESAKRNFGEAERNARSLSKLSGSKTSEAAQLVRASHIGTIALIGSELADELEISTDYVLDRVDKAEAAGRLVVERERVYA